MIALRDNVTFMADAKADYGESEAKGFVQVPRSLRQRCKKLNAGEWYVLMEVLDRGYSWGRLEPQKITLEEFCASSGLTVQAILNGIAGLVARGVLYEERTSAAKTSPTRYAIIDAANPETGPYTTAEGTLEILLLGGLVYSVDAVTLKNRVTETSSKNQSNVTLKNRVTSSKNQSNTQSRQPAQQAVPTPIAARSKKVIEERREEGNGADPLPSQQIAGNVSDSQAQPSSNAVWLSEESGQRTLFGEVAPVMPVKPIRSRPKKSPLADDPLVVAWLSAVNRKSKPTESELRDWNQAITDLKNAEPPVTPEEMQKLVMRFKGWRDPSGKLYRCRHPRVIARNLDGLREEPPDEDTARAPTLPRSTTLRDDGRNLKVLLARPNLDERPPVHALIPRGE